MFPYFREVLAVLLISSVMLIVALNVTARRRARVCPRCKSRGTLKRYWSYYIFPLYWRACECPKPELSGELYYNSLLKTFLKPWERVAYIFIFIFFIGVFIVWSWFNIMIVWSWNIIIPPIILTWIALQLCAQIVVDKPIESSNDDANHKP